LRSKTLAIIDEQLAYYKKMAERRRRWSAITKYVSILATVTAGILIALSHQDVAKMFEWPYLATQNPVVESTDNKGNTKKEETSAREVDPSTTGSSGGSGQTGTVKETTPSTTGSGKVEDQTTTANTAPKKSPPYFPLPGGWALLFALIAGAAMGVDKFAGLSKNWMRFILVRQEIDALRKRYDGDLLFAEMSGKAIYLLQRCRLALEELDEIVLEETKEWVRDYRENLEQLQNAVTKNRPGAQKPRQ